MSKEVELLQVETSAFHSLKRTLRLPGRKMFRTGGHGKDRIHEALKSLKNTCNGCPVSDLCSPITNLTPQSLTLEGNNIGTDSCEIPRGTDGSLNLK